MSNANPLFFGVLLFVATALQGFGAGRSDYFTIQVVDAETGRGVPLVELRTVNRLSFWTDSNGIIAFNEPGLMDEEVYFHVASPGYEYPKDMFNNRGVKLKPRGGESTTIKLKRLNIAERLYRITGQGIYRDSVLVGKPVPISRPVLDGKVMGQDTVIATPYRGKIYWFWGDTDRPSYPLGNFGASGATSGLPGKGGLDPSVGVDLSYFVDASGFSKPMCPEPKGGLHWIESVFTLRDERGQERLLARMANMARLGHATDWRLMIFNDEKQEFETIQRWDIHASHESAHPFRAQVDGTNYLYIFNDFRVPAEFSCLTNLWRYEAFTFIDGAGKAEGEQPEVRRDAGGQVQYRWVVGGEMVNHQLVDRLRRAGKVKGDEGSFPVLDFESGARLTAKVDTVAWNSFRQRWIALFPDRAGGVCFAEADTPSGPWGYGRSIANHGDYNFYNIAQHSFFDQNGGRMIYFEGTYTGTFSKAGENGTLTPRYEYNQIMYRVGLDDPRLVLPVAVYEVSGPGGEVDLCIREQVERAGLWERIKSVALFAMPRADGSGELVPVYAQQDKGTVLSLAAPAGGAAPLFFGLPLIEAQRAGGLAGTWDWRVKSASGGDLNFTAEFVVQGATVQLEGLGEGLSATGDFRDGKLRLTFHDKDTTYAIEGSLDENGLSGSWRKQDKSEQGSWSASPVNKQRPERNSTALVVLREYRRTGNGRRCYSIQDEAPAGYEAEGKAVCRVWKVPGTVLALDWKAVGIEDRKQETEDRR